MEKDVAAVSASVDSLLHFVTADQWNEEKWAKNDKKHNQDDDLSLANIRLVFGGCNGVTLAAENVCNG